MIHHLGDILVNLDAQEDGGVIYAKRPWTQRSEATVLPFSEDLLNGVVIDGVEMHYFLEVSIAKEVLGWCLAKSGGVPSEEERLQRIISYAENDA